MLLIISTCSNSYQCSHIFLSNWSTCIYILLHWFPCIYRNVIKIISKFFFILISKNVYCRLHIILRYINNSHFIIHFVWLAIISCYKFIAYLDWSFVFFKALRLFLIRVDIIFLVFIFLEFLRTLSCKLNFIIIFFFDITDKCSTSYKKFWSS